MEMTIKFLMGEKEVENLIECPYEEYKWKAILSSTARTFKKPIAIDIKKAIGIAERECRNWENFGDDEKTKYWEKAIEMLSSIEKEGKKYYVMSSADSYECFEDEKHWIIAENTEEAYKKTILEDDRVEEKLLSVKDENGNLVFKYNIQRNEVKKVEKEAIVKIMEIAKIGEYPALSHFVAELLWYGFENDLRYWEDFSDIVEKIKEKLNANDESNKEDKEGIWKLIYRHYLNSNQGLTSLKYFLDKTNDNYFLKLISSSARDEFVRYKKEEYYDFLADNSDTFDNINRGKIIEALETDVDSDAFERFVYELICGFESCDS